MINVGDNYKYVKDLVSKNDGAYISPEEYDRYANASSEEMYKDFLGERTNPQITFGKNRLIDQRLLVYKKSATLVVNNGVVTKPQKLKYILSMETLSGVVIKPLDDERKTTIKKDPLASPNEEDKYYSEDNTSYQLIGESSLQQVKISYLEDPQKCRYAYTSGQGGRPVYDPTNSINFLWKESETEELTNRILAKAGLSMKDPTVMQVSANNKLRE